MVVGGDVAGVESRCEDAIVDKERAKFHWLALTLLLDCLDHSSSFVYEIIKRQVNSTDI